MAKKKKKQKSGGPGAGADIGRGWATVSAEVPARRRRSRPRADDCGGAEGAKTVRLCPLSPPDITGPPAAGSMCWALRTNTGITSGFVQAADIEGSEGRRSVDGVDQDQRRSLAGSAAPRAKTAGGGGARPAGQAPTSAHDVLPRASARCISGGLGVAGSTRKPRPRCGRRIGRAKVRFRVRVRRWRFPV
jgi:hypothetical protein